MLGRNAMAGIPVKRLDSRGPIIPQASPKAHPQIKPHNSTGICMGDNTCPAFGMAWNAMGSTTHKDVQTAVIIDFLTVVIKPPKNI
jgi:hypothetical protein